MTKQTYVLDPDADTIIVLKNPKIDFAVWNGPMVVPTSPAVAEDVIQKEDEWDLPLRSKTSKKGKKKAKKTPTSWPPWPQSELEPVSEPSVESKAESMPAFIDKPIERHVGHWEKVPSEQGTKVDPMEGPSDNQESLFGNGSSHVQATTSKAPQPDPETDPEPEPEPEPEPSNEQMEADDTSIIFRVSSRPLALASGYFRSSLAKEGWLEGAPNEDDGLYHLEASEWDPEAFLTLLNIIHLRNRKVPRSLTLEILAKIAVLVDYYRCREAVEAFSSMWIERVQEDSPVPEKYGRETVLWLLIAWVFKLPREFKQSTAVALKQSTTPQIDTMDLLIPSAIVESLEHKRYQAIEQAISSCYDWLRKFRDTRRCTQSEDTSYSCNSILLGSLTKEMHRLGYLSPRPEVPFGGWSFESVCKDIRAMKSPTWCALPSRGFSSTFGGGYSSGYYNSNNISAHSCSLRDTVGKSIDDVISRMGEAGLELYDFTDRSEEQDKF